MTEVPRWRARDPRRLRVPPLRAWTVPSAPRPVRSIAVAAPP